jgi:hypothetical protein
MTNKEKRVQSTEQDCKSQNNPPPKYHLPHEGIIEYILHSEESKALEYSSSALYGSGLGLLPPDGHLKHFLKFPSAGL